MTQFPKNILEEVSKESERDFLVTLKRIVDIHSTGLSFEIFKSTVKELCVREAVQQYLLRIGETETLTDSDKTFLGNMKQVIHEEIDTIVEEDLNYPLVVIERIGDIVFPQRASKRIKILYKQDGVQITEDDVTEALDEAYRRLGKAAKYARPRHQ